MARKKKKKASRTRKPVKEKGAGKMPWMSGEAPWEEYSGLQVPMMGEDNKIVSILDIGGGRIKVTEPNYVSEGTGFDFGDRTNARVIFSQTNADDFRLDEDTKVQAMEQAMRFYRENPKFRAVVNGYRNFIIGAGAKVTADDENPEVQAYIDEFIKVNGLDGKDAEMVLNYMKVGENAVRWFTKDKNGRMARIPKIRIVPFWRITKVIKDPEDAEVDKGYEIQVFKTQNPHGTLEAKTVGTEELQFWRNADLDESRGEPPFLVIMRAAKWYEDWLKNRVILNRFRTAHVMFKKIKSGAPSRVSSTSSSSPDASKNKGRGGKLEKRLPKPGTVVTHNDTIEYEWKSPKLDASDAKSDGRAIILEIASGASVPEFLLGDASNANKASTLTAESPFIRSVQFWQDFFKSMFGDIYQRAIEHGIKTKRLKKTSTETVVKESGTLMRLVNKALNKVGLKEVDINGDGMTRRPVPTKTTVTIEYPTLLQRDRLKDAQSNQIDQNMGLASVETLRGKAGYDHETETRRIEAEREAGVDPFEGERDEAIKAEPEEEEDNE